MSNYSSVINDVYDILYDHETEGLDIYDDTTCDDIDNLFRSRYPDIQYVIDQITILERNAIIYFLAWAEDNCLQTVVFECR